MKRNLLLLLLVGLFIANLIMLIQKSIFGDEGNLTQWIAFIILYKLIKDVYTSNLVKEG